MLFCVHFVLASRIRLSKQPAECSVALSAQMPGWLCGGARFVVVLGSLRFFCVPVGGGVASLAWCLSSVLPWGAPLCAAFLLALFVFPCVVVSFSGLFWLVFRATTESDGYGYAR